MRALLQFWYNNYAEKQHVYEFIRNKQNHYFALSALSENASVYSFE